MISAAQFERRHSALSVNCKKVYAAVPISEPWSTSYILSEIHRLSSFTSNMRVLTGSLNQLKASGMVLEPSQGLFIRAPVKSVADKPEDIQIEIQTSPKKETTMASAAAKTPRTPIAILSELSARAKKLTDDIETAALEIDEYMAAKGADSEKLKQLQALLRA